MALDTRELFARILKCEAESEGEDGMKAIATLIMNRATVPYGEFARVNDGGNVRNILTQYRQFTCYHDKVVGIFRKVLIYCNFKHFSILVATNLQPI